MKRQPMILILLMAAGLILILVLVQKKKPQDLPEAPAEEVSVNPDPMEAGPTEPQADPGPASPEPEVPPAAPAATEASDPVRDRLRENFAAARQAFQQKEAIAQAKAADVHHLPQPTLEAARQLGEIAELEAQHPEQADNFRDFYWKCAQDDRTITVIRAQCLDKYVKAAKVDTAGRKTLLQGFPGEVVRLYEALQE